MLVFVLFTRIYGALCRIGVRVRVVIRGRKSGSTYRESPRSSESTTKPDMSLIEACASRLSVLRARAFARGVGDCVTFCLHESLIASPDEVEDTMRRYRDPLRDIGVPSEIVTTDLGPALCGAGKPGAAIRMLAAFNPGIELSSLEESLAARPDDEYFLAVAVQPGRDAIETVIAQVSYGGGDCRFRARLRSG